MSEVLNRLKAEKKKILVDLYNQCTDAQQDIFNRMYGSTDNVSDAKMDWAIQQCERTVIKNNEKIGLEISPLDLIKNVNKTIQTKQNGSN